MNLLDHTSSDPFLITDQETWSFKEFGERVEGMCAQLKSVSAKHIAFLAHTNLSVITLFFALWKLGKVACPLNTRIPHHPELLQKMLTKLDAQFFDPKEPKRLSSSSSAINMQDVATLLFTSGSSGNPKIASHSLENHIYNALGSNKIIPLSPLDVWHLSLPLFHVGGIAILFRSYLSQSSILISNNREKATHVSLVPTQFFRLQRGSQKLPQLKTILLGGAPILDDTDKVWENAQVLKTYGMTEMSSQIFTNGKVLPHAALKIGPSGEILVKGKTLFLGYFEKNQITKPPVDEDGWFDTHDIGEFDAWGELRILGRSDNLFISGGENIQPEEIENAIKKNLKLEEVIVVPLFDREYGFRPGVFVPEKACDLATIQEVLRPHLPKYKIPIKLFFFPPSKSVKWDRKALKNSANLIHP